MMHYYRILIIISIVSLLSLSCRNNKKNNCVMIGCCNGFHIIQQHQSIGYSSPYQMMTKSSSSSNSISRTKQQKQRIRSQISFLQRINYRHRNTNNVMMTMKKIDSFNIVEEEIKEIIKRNDDTSIQHLLFDNFVDFLLQQQTFIINEIQNTIEINHQQFTNDTWGIFDDSNNNNNNNNNTINQNNQNNQNNNNRKRNGSGGITRVIQNGTIIEKGACSMTLIQDGILTTERALTIQSRQQQQLKYDNDNNYDNNDYYTVQAGDIYSAAALSIVFHTRSPFIPTFRSDVRIFMVQQQQSNINNSSNHNNNVIAWFGGGADLTPYYLLNNATSEIQRFHQYYNDLCNQYKYNYKQMKNDCDEYFYIPSRNEYRGVGGIFFDDMVANDYQSYPFVCNVVQTWMKSWIPNIVIPNYNKTYTTQQTEWQLIRRGRYLEFNLLYDRGVKFGLMTPNPRVEGVMVSAPPQISYVYQYPIEPNSPEDDIMKILKQPIDWV